MIRYQILVVILILIVLSIIIGCSDNEISSPQSEVIRNEIIESEESNAQINPEEPFVSLEERNLPSESITKDNQTKDEMHNDEEIVEESKNYYYIKYGNTSGNIANSGYVAYDKDSQRHLISMHQGVYAFDPEENELHQIFTLDTSESVKFLNTSENWLYYISSETGNIMRRSIEDYSIVEIIYEGKATYLKKYNLYLYFLAEDGENSQLYYYKDSHRRIENTMITHVTNISAYGMNVFFCKNTSDSLCSYQVCDILESETKTLVKFDENLRQIESILAYGQFNNAMIIKEKDKSGLYLYEKGDLVCSITSSDGIEEFSSINYNGSDFYFIGKYEDNQLIFTLDGETYELREFIEIPEDSNSLGIINNWMYLKKKDTKQIYQLAPESEAFELLKP